MKQIRTISVGELRKMAEKLWGNFVKADEDLRDINLYPDKFGARFTQFALAARWRPGS